MRSESPRAGPVHPARLDDESLAAQCDVGRTRRSGPGGQNRNKVETAIVLTHRPSGLVVEASERRSQAENFEVALSRLRLKLALHVRGVRRADEPPSALWQSRCRGGRISVSTRHHDFPAILAEALDVIEAHHSVIQSASAALDCTPSQLLKLLRAEPRALLIVNERRGLIGLRTLQ